MLQFGKQPKMKTNFAICLILIAGLLISCASTSLDVKKELYRDKILSSKEVAEFRTAYASFFYSGYKGFTEPDLDLQQGVLSYSQYQNLKNINREQTLKLMAIAATREEKLRKKYRRQLGYFEEDEIWDCIMEGVIIK